MRNFKIILILFLGALCFYAAEISALEISAFPNSTSLQPMPDESVPNISGNIDWPNSSRRDQNTDEGENVDNPPSDTNTSDDGSDSTDSDSSADTSDPTLPNIDGANTDIDSNPTSGDNNKTSNHTGNYSTDNQQNFGPSNPSSGFNFDAFPSQVNKQTSNDSIQNDETLNNPSSTNQNNPQQQSFISKSSYIWAIFFGSLILLAAAFILWKLKRNPDDVNQ